LNIYAVILSEAKDLCSLLASAGMHRSFASLRMTKLSAEG